MGHSWKKSSQLKNSAQLVKFARVRKMCKIENCVTLKNGSRLSLEKLMYKETLRKTRQNRKMGHS